MDGKLKLRAVELKSRNRRNCSCIYGVLKNILNIIFQPIKTKKEHWRHKMNSEWKDEQFFQSSVVRIVRPLPVRLADVISKHCPRK